MFWIPRSTVLRTLRSSSLRSLSSSARIEMKVVPVPVREDNYAYLLIDEPSNNAAAVDPFDVAKVSSTADALGVHIVAAITTHHHHDHSGGNDAFALKYPGVPIYGGSDKIPALTKLVKDKDEFMIGDNTHIKCLATPCHTQDSICYYVTDGGSKDSGGVFTGDTLFIAGCGRFFEGTGAEMVQALKYLGSLPNGTTVYNGHEYTASNLAFAKSVDRNNKSFDKLAKILSQDRITTGRTTIGDEKEWNVFMCLESDAVRTATAAGPGTVDSEIMDRLRQMKNEYRA